jgi:AcrR family transcriptional regulator
MPKKVPSVKRRKESLSRERVIEVSIELLDSSGESGLTFRALSERLVTGPGAIYWHIDSKSELLTAACDSIVARTMNAPTASGTPEAIIRCLALGLYDAIDTHPWVGSTLTRAPGQLPIVRILERIGQQVCALGVPDEEQWATVSALLNYIIGVAGQNADNTQFARTHNLDRASFLETVSTVWSQLDPVEYPFARSVASQLPSHDDRADFIAGIDLILRGVAAAGER